MSRRSPRQTAAFSLFTFLDVMLCTLGALIIVLICVVRTAQIKNADAAPENLAELEELQAQRDMAQWRTKHLTTSLEASRAQLRDRRLELAHIEEHTRRLREQLMQLEAAEAALAKGQSRNAKLEHLRAEAGRLAALAAAAEADVAKARSDAQSDQPSYAVVPYDGPNQTLRRPMYIECTGDRIILQPENIEITSEDFLGPPGPGNPLAAGLRAAREYLARSQGTSQGEAGEPYPLLLVRPDGVDAFYAAKEAMSSWGSEFGYELIDQDWKLEFREPQPAMVEAMRLAVDEARIRQRALARAAPRAYAPRQREWYRVASQGGVVHDSGPVDDDGGSGGGYGRNGRSGRGGGRAYGGVGRPGWSDGGVSGQPGYTAGGSGRRGQPGAGGNSASGDPATADDNPYLAVANASGTGTTNGVAPGAAPGLGGAGAVPGMGTGPGTGNSATPGLGSAGTAPGVRGGGMAQGPGGTGNAPGLGSGGTAPGVGTGPGTGMLAGGAASVAGGMSPGPGLGTPNGFGTGSAAGSGSGPSVGPVPGDPQYGAGPYLPGAAAGQPTGVGGGMLAGANPANAAAGSGLQPGGTAAANLGPATDPTGQGRYGTQNSGAITSADAQVGGAAGTGRYGSSPSAGGAAGGQGGDPGAGTPDGPAAKLASNLAGGRYGGQAGGRYAGQQTGQGYAQQGGQGSVQQGGQASGQQGGNGSGPPGGQGDPSSGDLADGTSGGPSAGGAAAPSGSRPAGALANAVAQSQGSSGQSSGSTPGGPSLSASGGQSQPAAQSGGAMVQMGAPAGSKPTATNSLAERRGKNWGLPEEARRAVPITRPVRIECLPDKIVLRSEKNPSQTHEIPLKDRTEDSVEELVSVVWQRVDTWGQAGRGMYWHPVLSVDVAPGADGRFADLQTLLADSGLEVKQAAKSSPVHATQPKRKLGLW